KTLQPEAPPLSPLPTEPRPLPRLWRTALVLVLLTYLGFGIVHLMLTPVAPSSPPNYINAPDEYAHLEYIRSIAHGGRLPVQGDPVYHTYEWHQPPLYYMIAAPLYQFGPRAIRAL